jgi:TolB-like protein
MAATCADGLDTIQKEPLNLVPSCGHSGDNGMPVKSAGLSAKCTWARTTIALVMLALIGASLLASRPALAAPPSSYDDAIKQISSQLADAIASSGKKAVAVSAFTDLDGNVTEIGRFLAGDLSTSLAAQAKGFLVIDRTQSKGAPQAPGVDALVTGSITAFSDHVRLSTKLLDASNSAILGAATVDIPRTKDIDDLLAGSAPPAPAMKSGNSRPASSSTSTNSAAATNSISAPAAASPTPSGKAPRGSSKPAKTPAIAEAPSASGIGSVATDAYKVIATSVDRSGSNVTVTLEFDAVGENTVLLAMLPNQTYLTDETNVRWALAQPDTAKIFNVRGGFWHGIPLAKGAKIQTVLTFAPQGPATGKKFTLTIAEFRPKWNRVVAIQGLQ